MSRPKITTYSHSVLTYRGSDWILQDDLLLLIEAFRTNIEDESPEAARALSMLAELVTNDEDERPEQRKHWWSR